MSDMDKLEQEENFADLLAQHEAQANKLQTGQKVEGTVIAVTNDSVFVDLGIKQDAVMDRSEIVDADGNDTVKEGDKIEAWIVSLSSQGPRLSRAMIGSGLAALEEARDARLPVDGRVRGTCKGGYQIDLMGKTAFCPGSQMEFFPGQAAEELTGRQMQFLIIKVENHGRNIVVSRRALIEREKQENLDKLLSSLNIGDTVEGKISRLVPYGAFIELAPSVEGLAHISELSWSHLDSPDEAVSVGDQARVKITGIGTDEKGQTRIGLSLKQAQGDPWADVLDRFAPGDSAQGKVKRLAPFGAFVEIAPGIEGLVHLSEFSWEKRITKAEDFLAVGDEVTVKIRDISPESRRISLSIRDAQGDPWEDIAEKFPIGAVCKGTVESNGPHGLFVNLAPGITGLLPKSIVAASQELGKLGPGAELDVAVRSLDVDARRMGLATARRDEAKAPQEKDWRKHTRTEDSGMGIMAQALQKAFKNKGTKQ